MANDFDKILGSAMFDDDIKKSIKEAWETKVNEIKSSLRKDIEADVRKEFKEMFKNDSNNLVEAMNKMLSEAVDEYSKEQIQTAAQLQAEKEKVANELAEARKSYKSKLEESIGILEGFIIETLKSKVEEYASESEALRQQRVRLVAETQNFKAAQKARVTEAINSIKELAKTELSEKVAELENLKVSIAEDRKKESKELLEYKLALKEETQDHLNKFNDFVVEKLREELTEFAEDKKALNERRVNFELEAKNKLAEERKRFISVSKDLVSETVYNALKAEMTSIKEEIKAAAENNFGRHIFEAMKKEFYISKLANEKSVFNKMNAELNEAKAKLEESAKIIAKQTVLVEKANKMANVAKNDAIRTKTLNDLLRPLNKSNRELMESLLTTTKTEKLKESFDKLLPRVLSEKTLQNRSNDVLNEGQGLNKPRIITGDKQKRQDSATGAVNGQNKLNEERQEVLRLAGIIRKE